MPHKIFSKINVLRFSPLLVYAVAILFIDLGDGILSYVVPVYLEKNLGDASKMGMIMGLSSAAGVFFDILLGKSKIRSSRKFFIWAFFAAILFPLSISFLPPIVPVFILQMIIWGLYYELIAFSNYSFIHEHTSVKEHAKAWGLLSIFKSLSYMIGPIIAGYALDISIGVNTGLSSIFFCLAIAIFIIFFHDSHKKEGFVNYEKELQKKESFGFELRVWFTFFKKIWPIYIFSMVMTLVDSGFWTIGVLFSEELQKLHPFGEWFLVVYMIPSTFMGFFVAKLASTSIGKKRISMLCGILSGFFMFLLLFIQNVPLILLLVFVSSAFLSIAYPEMYATFEDYISRLGGFSDDMIGLQQTAGSIAYIIGPIVLGFLADAYGNRIAFSILGFTLMIVSVVSMIFTPRKIRMPQKALEVLDEDI